MKLKFVYDGQRVVFYNIEVTVVAVAWNKIPVFPVPFCMLYANVLCRNHLTIEQYVLGAVLFIVFFDDTQYSLNKFLIVGVV